MINITIREKFQLIKVNSIHGNYVIGKRMINDIEYTVLVNLKNEDIIVLRYINPDLYIKEVI